MFHILIEMGYFSCSMIINCSNHIKLDIYTQPSLNSHPALRLILSILLGMYFYISKIHIEEFYYNMRNLFTFIIYIIYITVSIH